MANEKRLIDANAMRERMFSYYECVNEHTSKSTYTGETLMDYEVADMIEGCIENAPIVDAVEVVRCKDCKYWSKEKDLGMFCNHWCSMLTETVADDFCSYGERKEA